MIKRIFCDAKQILKCLRIRTYTLTPRLPKIIYVIINNVCNLHCKMCDVGQNNRDSQFHAVMVSSGRQLDLEILKKLVDEVRSFRPILAVTSTEPLLFSGLFQLIRYAKNAGLLVHITTNGMLLSKYAQEIIDSSVDLLCVSIDGPKDIHNEIRGNFQSYQNAIEGIKSLLELKRRSNGKIKLGINFTISNYNYSYLLDFLNDISGIPLDTVTFSHLNYVTEEMAERHNHLYGDYCRAAPSSISSVSPLQVDSEVLAKQLSTVKKRHFRFKVNFAPDLSRKEIEVFYRQPEKIIGPGICLAPFVMAQLASNGDWVITTRCFTISMGNIFEDGFINVWRGSKYKRFRRWVRENKLGPACTRCCGAF